MIFTVNNATTPTIALTASSVVANGNSVTFTATATNAGISPVYTFSVNGTLVQTGAANTFSSSTLKVADSVSCTITSNALCTIANTATSNAIVMTTNVPLTLLSFGAEMMGANTVSNWQTANEINTNQFIIERSNDGANFTDIGSVNALGNTGINNHYQYTDINVANLYHNATLYYRLKMLDKDGRYTYSNLVVININKQNSFAMYPNPAHGTVTIDNGQWSIDNNTYLMITDVSGKLLKKQKVTNPNTTVNLAAICTGIYLVTIQSKEGTRTEKLIVK